MPDKKPTYNEIVKALEEWIKNYDGLCVNFKTLGNVLDLINRLKSDCENYKQVAEHQQSITVQKGFEIKRLKEEVERLQAENERLKTCVKTEKEVREIAKRAMEPLVKEITREQIDIAVKLAKIEAYKECIEKVKEHSNKMELVCSGALVKTEYTITKKDLDNLLKEPERKEGTTYDD